MRRMHTHDTILSEILYEVHGMFFHVPNNAIEISLSPALSRPCSSAGIALSMRAVRRFLTSGDESSMPWRSKVEKRSSVCHIYILLVSRNECLHFLSY